MRFGRQLTRRGKVTLSVAAHKDEFKLRRRFQQHIPQVKFRTPLPEAREELLDSVRSRVLLLALRVERDDVLFARRIIRH